MKKVSKKSKGQGQSGFFSATELEFLKELVEVHAPSGSEVAALKVWHNFVRGVGIRTEHDAYGNSWASVGPANAPSVVVMGHADEIGFMVNYIDDKGFLFVDGVGGWDRSILRGKPVVVHGFAGTVPGVFGSMAIHMQDRDNPPKTPKFEQVWVDCGFADRKQAEKQVQIGDVITLDAGFRRMGDSLFLGKALDNRIGIFTSALVVAALKPLEKKLRFRVIGAASVQEEIGCHGAKMLADRLKPDLAIAVDVTQSPDHPDVTPRRHGNIKLGAGPAIGRGSINHPLLVKHMEDTAKRNKIAFQVGADPRWSGTDGDMLFLANGGTPTTVLSLPLRYMHTPVEMADLKDLRGLVDWIVKASLGLGKVSDFAVKL